MPLGSRIAPLAIMALVAFAAPIDAQQGRVRGKGKPAAQAVAPPEIKLIYEREYFLYPAAARRDPFSATTRDATQGPRFEELSVLGVIYSEAGGRSVAVLSDGSGKKYRVRPGDVIGNARVLDIDPLRVVFAVDEFGVVRREMLELRKPRAGAQG